MNHVRETHERCGRLACNICELFVCKVCGCIEGSLATECPGTQVYASHGDAIYEGYIDFVDGHWVLGDSATKLLSDAAAEGCPGDAATCLCDTHVWARHEAALAKLSGKERKAARGKLLGSDFAVAQPPNDAELPGMWSASDLVGGETDC